MRAAAFPVAVGVVVEDRFHDLVQLACDHGLGDPVRDGGHAKRADTAALLVDLHQLDRRGKIAPRRHAVPQLVQVAFEVLLKLCQRLLVDARRTLVGLHLAIRSPNGLLGNHKRLCRIQRVPPIISDGCPVRFDRVTRPLRSTPITGVSPLLRDGPSPCPATGTQSLTDLLLGTLPLDTALFHDYACWHGPASFSGRQVPTFRAGA